MSRFQSELNTHCLSAVERAIRGTPIEVARNEHRIPLPSASGNRPDWSASAHPRVVPQPRLGCCNPLAEESRIV
jgi:hypothetical protein